MFTVHASNAEEIVSKLETLMSNQEIKFSGKQGTGAQYPLQDLIEFTKEK